MAIMRPRAQRWDDGDFSSVQGVGFRLRALALGLQGLAAKLAGPAGLGERQETQEALAALVDLATTALDEQTQLEESIGLRAIGAD
jgi:hypothetical protein